MAKRYNLTAGIREEKAIATRHKGAIPGVLYGHGLASKSVYVDEKHFNRVFDEAGSTSLVMLKIEDTEHPILIREVQYHPLKNHVLHVDFYQVRMNEKITAEVPLTFTGESPAVKNMGGVLVRSMDSVEVEALPLNLPHSIEVDISLLNTFDDVLHISDLQLSEDVTVLQEAEEVIALVQEPKTQEQIDADLAEDVKEDVEGVEGATEKGEEAADGEAADTTDSKSE